MRARLMDRDRDFDLDAPLPVNADDLDRDLGLEALYDVMAESDAFLRQVARSALLSSLEEPSRIAYRQAVLTDCLRHPDLPREIYGLAGEALLSERKIWGAFSSDSPSTSLHRSVQVLELLVASLRELRRLAERRRRDVSSLGLSTLFDMLLAELDDDYFALVEDHLEELQFKRGLLLSARLGQGLHGVDHVVRRPKQRRSRWAEFLGLPDRSGYRFTIPDRDEAGWQALSGLRDQALAGVARAAAESTEHLKAFFTMLRREIGFYVGCVQLHDRLARDGRAACLPTALEPGTETLECTGLYELGLALRQGGEVIGNDVIARRIPLIVVTGANQGGKSTFLRSVGIAVLMMQCGMFVPAASFTGALHRGVFTHYRREEDASMTSGKLDEELARMSQIADAIRPGSLLLSNESFASTNEREGSQIARQVFLAMTGAGITVVAVTHLFDLASSLHQKGGRMLSLRAERQLDGRRTFRLIEGEPLSTSFGKDIYARVFRGDEASPEPRPSRAAAG